MIRESSPVVERQAVRSPLSKRRGDHRELIHAVATLRSTPLGDHDDTTVARIVRQQTWTTGRLVTIPFESVMSRWEHASRSLAMQPRDLVVDDLASSNVMADEKHQLTLHAGQHFLKRLQHKRDDQQMIVAALRFDLLHVSAVFQSIAFVSSSDMSVPDKLPIKLGMNRTTISESSMSLDDLV